MAAIRTLTLTVTALSTALAATVTAAVAQPAPTRLRVTVQDAPVRAHYAGPGFDKCTTPSTADMRSWLDSPYRAVNIYFGGSNRACPHQPELTTQWVSTVTANGWALIPTYVGLQSKCQGYKPNKFTDANATASGRANADDAVAGMQALGLGAGTPVYFDMEPFNTSNDTCRHAAVKFISAWTAELHAQGYRSGLYAHPAMGLKPLVNNSDPKPDDVWWPRYDGNPSTTAEPTLAAGTFTHRRIHQYAGSTTTTVHGVTFSIDRDSVDADVVGAVTPSRPSGPPYVYAASPPDGATVKERTSPTTKRDNRTGVTYAYGTALPIACQAAGQKINGSYVWDRLTNGDYVADINTTTTGGLSFTRGIPHCDTAAPTATLNPTKVATTAAGYTFSWSAVDAAPSGQRTSGISSYDVRYRRAPYDGGFGRWKHVNDLTSTQTRLLLDPGYDYCVEVRATDRSFNTGRWSAQECVARAVDDRALSLATHGWTRDTAKRYYFRTVTQTTHKGRVLTLHGTRLRQVGVVASRCRGCGNIAVYVGSIRPGHLVGTVTLAGPRRDRRLTLLPAFGYTRKPVHLVTTKRAKTLVDGVAVIRHL